MDYWNNNFRCCCNSCIDYFIELDLVLWVALQHIIVSSVKEVCKKAAKCSKIEITQKTGYNCKSFKRV